MKKHQQVLRDGAKELNEKGTLVVNVPRSKGECEAGRGALNG